MTTPPRPMVASAMLTTLLMATPAVLAQADDPQITILESSPDTTVLVVELPPFTFETVKVDGVDMHRPVMLGATSPNHRPGDPDLPQVVRSLRIPNDMKMDVQIRSMTTSTLENVVLAPDRGDISRSEHPDDVPWVFGDSYQKDDDYPQQPAELGRPWIMRDQRGVDLRITPFQYNPVQRRLTVIEKIELKVSPIGPGEVNLLQHQRDRSARMGFREAFAAEFINWHEWTGPWVIPGTPEMLVIAPEAWLDEAQPLVDHRNNEGIITITESIEHIGNTPAEVKDYITNLWLDSDLTYVLLIGDMDEIPTETMVWVGDTGGMDPEYGYLLGDDKRPEVYVGRFPARDEGEVTLMVDRTIAFENQLGIMNPHRSRGLGIASDDEGAEPDDGELDWEHLDNIRAALLASHYTEVAQVYEPAAVTAHTANALENGVGFVNYTGHGGQNSWTTSAYTSADVNALENVGKWPWIISVACDVGRWNDGDCLGEAFLRARLNGTNEPTGAVAMFGGTINQSWAPPMEAQDVIGQLEADGLFRRIGPRCAQGTNAMIAAYPDAGPRNARTWNLLGDPALRLNARSLVIRWPAFFPWTAWHGIDPLPSQLIEIENLQEYAQDIEFLWDCPWIHIHPLSMHLEPGDRGEIEVSVDTEKLLAMGNGDHLGSILIYNRTTGLADQACIARGEVTDTAPCASDLDGSGRVDIGDLLAILDDWGACTDHCATDLDGNGWVDIDDLLTVLSDFGPC